MAKIEEEKAADKAAKEAATAADAQAQADASELAKAAKEATSGASDGGSREARWKAFLEVARGQNATFAEQEARGEFETIPDSFV